MISVVYKGAGMDPIIRYGHRGGSGQRDCVGQPGDGRLRPQRDDFIATTAAKKGDVLLTATQT